MNTAGASGGGRNFSGSSVDSVTLSEGAGEVAGGRGGAEKRTSPFLGYAGDMRDAGRNGDESDEEDHDEIAYVEDDDLPDEIPNTNHLIHQQQSNDEDDEDSDGDEEEEIEEPRGIRTPQRGSGLRFGQGAGWAFNPQTQVQGQGLKVFGKGEKRGIEKVEGAAKGGRENKYARRV